MGSLEERFIVDRFEKVDNEGLKELARGLERLKGLKEFALEFSE